MALDPELDRLLEELDLATRRLDTRKGMIEEALMELASSKFVILEGYLGFGKNFRVNEAVREALRASAEEELADLKADIDAKREAVMARREGLLKV